MGINCRHLAPSSVTEPQPLQTAAQIWRIKRLRSLWLRARDGFEDVTSVLDSNIKEEKPIILLGCVFSHLPVCHGNILQQSSVTCSVQRAGRCDSCWLAWPLMFLSAYKLVACGFDDQIIVMHASGFSSAVCLNPTQVLCSELCPCLMF